MCVYIYIYIYIGVCVYIYIYICTHMFRWQPSPRQSRPPARPPPHAAYYILCPVKHILHSILYTHIVEGRQGEPIY